MITEKLYKNQNGFLVDDESNHLGYSTASITCSTCTYTFGRRRLFAAYGNPNDIPYSYAFDYCDINYMWSTFYITINIGIRDLYTINFDSNGGSECQA